MHESLQVQCIDVILRSRDNVQAKCTELVVIRARMSDLLCNGGAHGAQKGALVTPPCYSSHKLHAARVSVASSAVQEQRWLN